MGKDIKLCAGDGKFILGWLDRSADILIESSWENSCKYRCETDLGDYESAVFTDTLGTDGLVACSASSSQLALPEAYSYLSGVRCCEAP
ncbi:hypothetical protein KC357_g2 [Hortaea werneckii]|nr:hypothetical protein KC357_g2 [Hortaea werneckii]